MIDYVLFFLEPNAAKQRLARLFQSEGLVPGKQLSATVFAANSSCADPIAINQTTEGKKISWWQKQSFRRPSRYHEHRVVGVSGQRAQRKRIDADRLGTAFRNQAPRRLATLVDIRSAGVGPRCLLNKRQGAARS